MRKSIAYSLEILTFIGLIVALYCGILRVENQIISGVYYSLEILYFYSGWAGFVLLFVGLFLANPYGRIAGMLAFVAICLHFLMFIDLDFGLNINLIAQKVINEIPLIVGFIAFIALFIVFLVSLFHCFRILKMYFCVYFAILCALIHIVMLQKILHLQYITLIIIILCALGFKLFKKFLRHKFIAKF